MGIEIGFYLTAFLYLFPIGGNVVLYEFDSTLELRKRGSEVPDGKGLLGGRCQLFTPPVEEDRCEVAFVSVGKTCLQHTEIEIPGKNLDVRALFEIDNPF